MCDAIISKCKRNCSKASKNKIFWKHSCVGAFNFDRLSIRRSFSFKPYNFSTFETHPKSHPQCS